MKSKLFSLIISVLAAMCLWVYVMTVVNPDVDLTIGNIPVTFSGAEVLREDHGLVITGDYQEFVSVHFYGKNADLKTLDQHKDEIKAVIDVSNRSLRGHGGRREGIGQQGLAHRAADGCARRDIRHPFRIRRRRQYP